jgi:hypothetical protein
MASAGLLQPGSKILVASNTVTATGQSAAFTMPFADSYRLILITSAASGTTPTLDAVLQDSPDGGTTWVNLPLRFTQQTAAGNAWILFKPIGLSDAASAGTTAATGGALGTNTPFNAKYVRLAYTVGGTTPSFTFILYANMVGRGETAS